MLTYKLYCLKVLAVVALLSTPLLAKAGIPPPDSLKQPWVFRFGVDAMPLLYTLQSRNTSALEAFAELAYKQHTLVLEPALGSVNVSWAGGNYNNQAALLRVGYDQNFLCPSKHVVSLGGRFAYANYTHSLRNANLFGYGVWPNAEAPDLDGSGSYLWCELALGIKAQLFKGFMLGITARMPVKLVAPQREGVMQASHIYGFGPTDNSVSAGLNYYIGYYFGR